MNNSTIYHDIIALLQSKHSEDIILYKGEEELSAISNWLRRDNRIKREETPEDLSLAGMIKNCHKCNNIIEKKVGFGSGKNGVMIVLHSPRLISKAERDLFKKDSIQLLKKIVQSIHLSFSDCYITNLVKCDIGDSLVKFSNIINDCSGLFMKEIAIIKPKIVIVMGDIIPLQGIIKSSSAISWYNIEHPITLIKNPELKRSAWNTLKIVKDALLEK